MLYNIKITPLEHDVRLSEAIKMIETEFSLSKTYQYETLVSLDNKLRIHQSLYL